MFYILVNPDNSIRELIDGDRTARPPGSIQISDVDAETIYRHPIGPAAFDYINGAVVENQAVIAERLLVASRVEMIARIRAEGRRRLEAIDPDLADETTLAVIRIVVRDTSATLVPDSALDKARQTLAFMRARVDYARTATQSQLDNYDPAADPGWPA